MNDKALTALENPEPPGVLFQSTNYVENQAGWRVLMDGTAQFNSDGTYDPAEVLSDSLVLRTPKVIMMEALIEIWKVDETLDHDDMTELFDEALIDTSA